MLRLKTRFEQVPMETVKAMLEDQARRDEMTELRQQAGSKMRKDGRDGQAPPAQSKAHPNVMLCRVHLEEVASELSAIISSMAAGDQARFSEALGFVQQARQALSDAGAESNSSD